MSLDKIKQLVHSLSNNLENNQKLATAVLAAKAEKYSVDFPEDQTLGAMSRVLSKMADNNCVFIKRAELQGLYQKLYSRHTKFAQIFSDELGIVESVEAPVAQAPQGELQAYQVEDTVLANALSNAFDNKPILQYSPEIAEQALKSVNASLDAWHVKPSNLKVAQGSDKFLVIQANYETPKGITSFFIPVETSKNKVLAASVFMGNSGPQELNYSNIKKYLTSFTGNKLAVTAANIMSVLTDATSEKREVSGAELALTRLNASRQGTADAFANGIVGQKIAEAAPKEVTLPKSDEFISFEKKFASAAGAANLKFGAAADLAMQHVARELRGFGHKNPQITVEKTTNNTIFYNVALDAGRVAFVVPVKIADRKVVKASLLICNGSMLEFSKDGINELYVNNATDYKAAAAASPMFEKTSGELIAGVKEALAQDNMMQVEDILNILDQRDQVSHAMAFQLVLKKLAGKEEKLTKCAHQIHSSTSEHPICSQTGLPTHKIYQDDQGNCRPNYRRGMEDKYEGAIFNTSKILG